MRGHHLLLPAIALLSQTSCDRHDNRLSHVAQQVVREQARQNERASQQAQQTALAAQRLVEADAQSRQELLRSQHEFQQEIARQRHAIDAGRQALEQERQRLAKERLREPLIAETLAHVGMLLAAVLPLSLAVYALRCLNQSPDCSAELSQLLAEELSDQQPQLLPGPAALQRLEHHPLEENDSFQPPP